MNPPLYTQAAFAALAGVPVETVANWVRTGAVESVKLGNNPPGAFSGVNQ